MGSKQYRYNHAYVEAIQLTEDNVDEVLEFCGDMATRTRSESGRSPFVLQSLVHGEMFVYEGMWIIRRSSTRYLALNDDQFRQNYTEVRD